MAYFAYTVNLLFVTYTVLIFLRLLSSWFPAYQGHKFIHFLAFYTDPYLNIFRRIIPPIGGGVDLSPILAIIALRVIESLILGLVRWIF
jgi:YggT family protein